MGALELQGGCGCEDTTLSRCGATLPDSPACAINYHFGMLLGVDDFRTEQGFHVGRLRRHQRALHGFGVVHGYAVSADPAHAEIKVSAGYAIDPHGRDLAMGADQCLGLPAWWLKHRADDEFADVPNKDDVVFDADVLLCHSSCLSRPVPAIADTCAGGSADIAFSRICESVQLKLVVRRHDSVPPVPIPPARYHLLRLLLGLDPAQADGGGVTLPDDAWLLGQLAAIAALPEAERAAARDVLWIAVKGGAAAASAAPIDAGSDLNDEYGDDCLTIASLTGIHIFLDHADPAQEVWKATVDQINIDRRPTLLPSHVLQAALRVLAEPPPAPPAFAGPLLQSATLLGQSLTLVFDKPLAGASVTAAVFILSAFDPVAGWSTLTSAPPQYDNANTVTLSLDAAPPAGARIRITVHGSGPTPLLGADFIPAGARTSDSDGSNLSTTIAGE